MYSIWRSRSKSRPREDGEFVLIGVPFLFFKCASTGQFQKALFKC